MGEIVGPYDVKIKMKAVGICGSDVHFLKVLPCFSLNTILESGLRSCLVFHLLLVMFQAYEFRIAV